MGKKRHRKKLVSKGLRSKVAKSTIRALAASRDFLWKLSNKTAAWKKFQNPWITIENPDKSATNRRFIRVRANELWGNPKVVKE
jgi:hypothetical protein